MLVIQVALIIFLFFILAVIYQDEYRKKRLARKIAKTDRFWDSGKERRQNTRIDTKLDVLYEVTFGRSAQKRNSISRNISLGGISLTLNEKLLPGMTLKLQFDLPDKPIFAQGKISWIKELSGNVIKQGEEQRLFSAGIEFTQIDPRDESLLSSFISQHLKNATGKK